MSQFQAHPVMIVVLTVQQHLLADRTLSHESLAFVEHDGALMVRANTQIDLLDDSGILRPLDEAVL